MTIRCDPSLCVNTCLVLDYFIDDGNIFHRACVDYTITS